MQDIWTKRSASCERHNVELLLPTVQQILQLLTEIYQANSRYWAPNTAWSALATVVTLPADIALGSHPLISRFSKGVFQTRPALPRYTQTWDVDIALKYLPNVTPVTQLSWKELSNKVTTLLLLLSRQWIQTIHLLNINSMKFTNSSITFHVNVNEEFKQSGLRKHWHDLCFKAYAPIRRVCIVIFQHSSMQRNHWEEIRTNG